MFPLLLDGLGMFKEFDYKAGGCGVGGDDDTGLWRDVDSGEKCHNPWNSNGQALQRRIKNKK